MKRINYGWVIVLIAFCILTTHVLIVYTFGIFLIPLTTEFNWDRGPLSGVVSVSMTVAGALSILSGRLSDKYGPRPLVTATALLTGAGFILMSQINSLWQVYLIWGLLMGVGGSSCEIPIISTISKWFVKRRGIAIGIAITGFGLGAILWPPLAQWLISTFGWRQSFIILGMITLIIITPLAQLLKHSPQRAGLKPYGEDGTEEGRHSLSLATIGLSFKQAIKTGRFWIFGVVKFCFIFYLQMIIVHIAPMAIDTGISAIVAASILSIIGGISIVGRLTISALSDRLGSRLILTVCLGTTIPALIWLVFARETWMFFIFAVIFGLAYGGLAPAVLVVPAELFGLRSLGTILGSFMLFSMAGGAVGAPFAGRIFDITGNYNLALWSCVVISAVATILSISTLRYKDEIDAAVSTQIGDTS